MEASEKSNLPKFYLNLKSYRKSLFIIVILIPAVNLVFALDEALKMMREEGLENILRHNKHKLAMSNAAKALNLNLFADEKYLSPSITAIKTVMVDAKQFRKRIKNKFDILLAGGQDH